MEYFYMYSVMNKFHSALFHAYHTIEITVYYIYVLILYT